MIQNITANGSTLNTTYNNGGNGETRVSLRNLGSNRTLVLVNGRRWVAGTGLGGAVDLNTIPTAAVERIAAGAFTREALALVRNEAFGRFCWAEGDDETARLYAETIQPDERHHHELGRKLLLALAVTEEAQAKARAASERVLAMAEELQEIARLERGITRAPGC